jgi:hypothetical protein
MTQEGFGFSSEIHLAIPELEASSSKLILEDGTVFINVFAENKNASL